MANSYANIPVPTPTQNAVPSADIRDHVFGGAKIDEFVTSKEHDYVDRFGNNHRTIEGINYDANQAILNYGYITKDSFEDGSTISLANECLRWKSNGEYYRWDGTFPKVVPPGSTPDTTGGIGEGKWVSVGDASLRSNLAAPDGYQLIGGLAEHYSLPSSTIVVDNAPYNGDLKAALNAAPEGSTLLLGKTTAYNIAGLYSGSRNTKKNILIVGMGMPELSADKSRFVEGSGTIIRGSVKNEAKGFKIFNLGIDCGNYVSQNLYSPVTYEDALQIYGVGDNANIGIDKVKTLNSLGISSNPGTHSILLEALSGVTLGYVECIGGYHGLTIKCKNLRGGRAHCYMQYGDGWIIKSDSGAVCQSIHMDSITVGLADTSGWPNAISLGGIYDAHDGVGISDIHIGKYTFINASWGLISADNATGFVTQVTLGEVCGIQTFGNYYTVTLNAKCVNWTIGSHQFSGVSGGIKVDPAAAYCHIGNGSVTGSSVSGYSLGGDTNTHGTLISNGNGGYGVDFTGGLGFNPDIITAYSNALGNFSSLPSVVAAAPVNNWAQGADFKATSMGHRVHVSGSFVRGATSGANMVQLLSTAQPAQAVTLMAWSSDTGAIANVYVDTDGFLKCANFNTIASGAVVKIMGSYLKK
ncbi:phage tail protein [Enterobacter roggenkampii]|uniref:tail fiber/spike domain-containing protein n=1 Tax=Enterobacter roggenkampii TaxID=1812935 RepID=UPI0013EF8EF1|nr:phage tail protein [Enterobacter roggenkampii]NHA09376.1 phage tail protein [Enterobacter roggenkampii]